MKTITLLISMFILLSCEPNSQTSEADMPEENLLDVKAELAAIEDTRASFQLAIKEKRYGDLGQYATTDMKGVSPGNAAWMEYKRLREAPMGMFSYDSIIMSPQETVLASDSVAYDYGTSTVYYTNEEGEAVELKDTYLVILKKNKEHGRWQIHREVASSVVE